VFCVGLVDNDDEESSEHQAPRDEVPAKSWYDNDDVFVFSPVFVFGHNCSFFF
jgi:hypothetical protein